MYILLCIISVETVTLLNYHKAITLPTLGDAKFEHLLKLRIGRVLTVHTDYFMSKYLACFPQRAEQAGSLPNHKVSSF